MVEAYEVKGKQVEKVSSLSAFAANHRLITAQLAHSAHLLSREAPTGHQGGGARWGSGSPGCPHARPPPERRLGVNPEERSVG